MGKFKLAFGIHNHQPVGNFEAVFEEAHQRAYLPFLKLVSSHDVSISLHQSGILWNWQKRVHPEFFEVVRGMIDRGQVELMTGGFYEPILTSIPTRDALGQINMLSQYLSERFEVDPRGFWLTERIWEPHLPKLLAQAGVTYLPIDDTHFIYAGFEQSQLAGPFVTEDEGHTVRLLPIQKRLRYLIPFGTIEEVIQELRSQAERNPEGMAIYADDGEKFGIWPNTHKHCYEDGWLERFFGVLEENSDWLEVVSLGEAAQESPVGRAYLPTASYEEMLHWSLPPIAFVEYEAFEKWLSDCGQKERYSRFVRGGHWRGFLVKYYESNLMHKKMLWVSRELADFEEKHPERRTESAEARDCLYAAQCNCPYWHGVFGGLYLPHIRQAVYGKMIDAHSLLRHLAGEKATRIEQLDYDTDGVEEVICDSDDFTAVFKPNRGAMLVDLSLNRYGFDLTDTLSRRKEGYHLKLDQAVSSGSNSDHASIHDLVLAKEEGLAEYLVEDWYLKRCFIDHFFPAGTELEDFGAGNSGEEGDFVLEPYRSEIDKAASRVVFTRHGHIRRPEGVFPAQITKAFVFPARTGAIDVTYELSSSYPGGVDVDFAVENNMNFQAGHAEDRYVLVDSRRPRGAFLDSTDEHFQAHTVALVDQYRLLAAALTSSQPATVWHLPIFTVSLSEGGFERVYQGTTIIHKYRLHLTDRPHRIRFALFAGEMNAVLENAFPMATVGR